MANDPDRDMIPTKEVKQSYPASEISEKHSPEKKFALHFSKTDLEDQFYKFKEENFQLKKATRKQEDELKRLATKMNRLLREKKSTETMSNPGYKRDLELEEMVEDLQDKVHQLEKSNTQLREKALVAKQQVIMQNRRPNPYNHIPAKVNSGNLKSTFSPYVSSINVRGKNLQNSPKKLLSSTIPPYALSLLDEARNELSNLKMLVSNQKTEIEMYEQENDILKQKMRMREIEFEDELNSLKCQLTQRQRQHVQENLDLIRLHREINQKSSKILTIQAQYSDLEEKMHILKLNHDRLVKDMDDLNIQHRNEQKKNLELLSELQKAEVSFSASSELQDKLKSLLKENDVLRETNDKLLQNALAFEKEKSFNQMEEILKGKIANLESLLEIQSKTKASVDEELVKERENVKLKEEAYNHLNNHFDQMKSHMENLEAKINILKLEEIEFDDLEKALVLLKQSREKSPEVSATDGAKLENCVPNNLHNTETSPPSKEPEFNDSKSNINESSLHEATKETKLALSTATEEIEKLKAELEEGEEKYNLVCQELDNVKETLNTQHNMNENAQEEEVKLLREKLEQQEKEFHSKLEEYSHMLDIRATRIQKLERQLSDIAYGTKTFSMTSPNENEVSSPVKLSRGENIFEIHINKINFTSNGIKQLYSPSSNIFLTWNFYEFELQSTPIISSQKPVFDFTAQYTVQVDDYFLCYLHDSTILIELHESLGVDYRTLASCQLKFSDIFKTSTTKIHGTEALIGVEEASKFAFGSVDYWVQMKIPMEEAFKFFKEKIKALKYIHSNKEMSSAAIQLLKQPYDKDSNVNQLHIKILRAVNLKSRQTDVQPTSYCVYKFYDLPDQDTAIIPASNNPEFLSHHTFSLYIDPDIEKYLKTENLIIYVFDDNDPDINSYIGKVAIQLYPLVQNKEIKGGYPLQVNNEPDRGSIEILIFWEYDYKPATSDATSLYSKNKELLQKTFKQSLEPNSDVETVDLDEPTLEYSIPTPPVPKPRKLPAKQMTSTPVSNNSGLSSPNSNGIPSSASPNLSPVHKIDSLKSDVPQPAQRKSKLSNDESTQKSDHLYTIKEKMQKLYDDELSDDLSDSEQKISFDEEATDEEKQDSVYDYSEESESDSEIYSEHVDKKPVSQVPTITILISYLSLGKDAVVLLDSTIKLLYIEYQFLNYPIEELETPVSLPKKGYPDKIEYNFKKVFTLEPKNLEKWNLLSKMLTSDSPDSSLIKFTLVSEPPPEDQDIDCEDVGYGYVDLYEILKVQKDKINEDILIHDARDSSIVIGVLNISIQALEALLLMKTFSSLHPVES